MFVAGLKYEQYTFSVTQWGPLLPSQLPDSKHYLQGGVEILQLQSDTAKCQICPILSLGNTAFMKSGALQRWLL